MNARCLGLLSLTPLIVAGCHQPAAPGPGPAPIPSTFSAAAVPAGEPLPGRWWTTFDDAELNALMTEALGGNFTLRAAWDRLTQAEQVVRQARAALIPSVNYALGAKRQVSEVAERRTYTGSANAGLSASYELDLWGRWRAAERGVERDLAARREDVAAAAMTISAAVARTWVQLNEAEQQVRVIGEQRDTNRDVLRIVTLSFRQGKLGAEDVFRQRQLVQGSEGQLIQAQERVVILQHGLSVLLGRNPDTWWTQHTPHLPELPPLPATGLPSAVMQRRPDVRSALEAIRAADARVALAVADQYPAVSLGAGVESRVSHAADLFRDWSANLTANLVGPLVDANRRRAEVARQRALLSERVHAYGQTVLEALREVQDALAQERHQAAYLASVTEQWTTSRQVLERLLQNYRLGQLDYLRVLESLSSSQGLERSTLTARRVLWERRIDLCRAIGGGWDLPRPAPAYGP